MPKKTHTTPAQTMRGLTQTELVCNGKSRDGHQKIEGRLHGLRRRGDAGCQRAGLRTITIITAIAALVLDGESILSAADNPADAAAARRDAIEQIDDQKTLADIAKNDDSEDVSVAAVKRLSNQTALVDVAQFGRNHRARMQALSQIDDQGVLEKFARNHKEAVMRITALRRITNEDVFVEIAQKDQTLIPMALYKLEDRKRIAELIRGYLLDPRDELSWWVGYDVKRLTDKESLQEFVFGKLTDQELLASLVTVRGAKDNSSAREIRQESLERVTEQKLLADIAKAGGEGSQFAALYQLTEELLFVDVAKNAERMDVADSALEKLQGMPLVSQETTMDVAKVWTERLANMVKNAPNLQESDGLLWKLKQRPFVSQETIVDAANAWTERLANMVKNAPSLQESFRALAELKRRPFVSQETLADAEKNAEKVRVKELANRAKNATTLEESDRALAELKGWPFSQEAIADVLKSRAEQARVEEAPFREMAAKVNAAPGLALEMLCVPAGYFVWDRWNGTAHITKPFLLGKYEVTQAQWKAVMGNNPSRFKGENRPVEMVSWNDAMAFCKKLTERERMAGRLPAEYEYTLPTEAQWVYACRAGTEGDYGGTGNLDDMGWYAENSRRQTHPVGQKQANAWGFYDMHGNVAEWCLDGGQRSYSVWRGGSYSDAADHCRSNHHIHKVGEPDLRLNSIGFRLALVSVRKDEK